MADGMNFIFTIDSNTPGLDTLLASLDKANVSMEKGSRGLKGIDDGSRKASEGTKTLGGAFEKLVTKGLEPFLKKAKSIAEFEFIREGAEKLLEFPGELAEKIKELGEDAIMTAAKTERMGRAFENALGKDVGKDAFEYFDAIADKTEFTHEQIRGMGLELAKSGFKGEGLKNAAAAISDLGSMTADPVAGAEAATGALQRIMTTGRVEGRALEPFGIHKGDFEKELSAETGLGLKAMHKAMEAGTIPTETVLNSVFKSITNKTGEDLGTLGTHMADTLESRLAHLKEKPDLLFEGLKDTAGFQQISEFIGRLGDSLNPDSALGKILSSSLSSALGSIGDTLAGLDLNDIFTKAADVIKGLPDDLKLFGQVLNDQVIPAVKDLLALMDVMLTTINGFGVAAHFLSGHKTAEEQTHAEAAFTANQQTAATGGFFDKVVANLKAPFLAADSGLEKPHDSSAQLPYGLPAKYYAATKNAGANDVKGYAQGVESSTAIATGAMSSMADATTDALKDAHQQKSPSRLFAGIGEMDAEGYAMGIEGSADRISDAIDSTFSQPSASPAVTGSAGQMTVVIERIEVNIEGSGGDPYEQGRLAARGMEDELELTLTRVLEAAARRRGN